MSVVRCAMSLTRLFAAILLVAQFTASAWAQTQSPAGRAAIRRQRTQEAEAALGDADRAVTKVIDSIFAEQPPADPLSGAAARAMGVPHSAATRKGGFEATLVHNPDQSDGNPPFALADRYGGVIRYVEPVQGVDLDRHVGQRVVVRRDTGSTLLASQLELPRSAPIDAHGVMLAQHTEELPAGTVIEEGGQPLAMPETQGIAVGEPMGPSSMEPIPMEGSMDGEPLYLDDGLDFPGGHSHMGDACPQCGGMSCPPGGCGFGSRPIFYARFDYLAWWGKGMDIPPLVVRGDVNDNGTPTNAADDFFDNASVVYGNQQILKQDRSGGRVILGYWLDDYGQLGVEGEYFGLGTINERFVDGGNGTTPIVGRPFIDATTGLNAVEDVSFPGIAGTVTVDSSSQLQGAGIRLRRNLCCVSGCGPDCGDCVGCGSPVQQGGLLGDPIFPMFARGSRHVDFIAGVRWLQLDESLGITEDLRQTAAPNTTFLLNDRFGTSNVFFGADLGYIWEWRYRRWALDVLSKVGIGNTRQQVAISGSTIRDRDTVDEITKANSGLLAQPSNVGVYNRNVFSMVPEIGVTLGYDLTQRLRFNVGYSLIYWSRVARPGDQIDLHVNPDYLLFAGDTGFVPPDQVSPAAPQFTFRDTDFWVQGITAGFLYHY